MRIQHRISTSNTETMLLFVNQFLSKGCTRISQVVILFTRKEMITYTKSG